MIVRQLITRFGFDVNQAQLRRYESRVNSFRNQADAAAESFRNMFAAFLGFGAIQSIAKTADQMQSLEARIGQLPQTITSAADAFDVVSQRASDARQSIDAYASFYVKLQHAGKDFVKTQEEGLMITDTISKALILGGATAQEQASALLQFGQAIGSNTLAGEEFRALSEAAPQLVDAISRNLGIARGDLKKYASEGKLTSKVVVEAVKAISSEFDARFKEIPLTIGTATTIIGNRWARFINRLNRESSAVTKIANFFLRTFDNIEAGLSDMVDFFGGATNTLKFFGIALSAALAPWVFKQAAGAIVFFTKPLGLLILGLLVAGLVIEDFYQWMTGGDSVFQQWLGNFDDAKKKMKEYEGVITFVRDSVIVAVGVMALNWTWAAGVAVASAAQAFGAWIIGLARFAGALLFNSLVVAGWVGNLLISLGTLVIGWVSSFVSMTIAAAPVLLPILAIAAGVAAIIAVIFVLLDNWKNIFDMIAGIATGNWDRVADGFYGMVEKLKGYWNSFKSFFGMKVEATVGANSANPTGSTIPSMPIVATSVAAGAAASPNGVPVANNGGSVVLNVNQTLPPGTSSETAAAARDAINQAFNALPIDRLARQMGQVGG